MSSTSEPPIPSDAPHDVVFELLAAAAAITSQLDAALSNVRGISFSEYQLVDALARESPRSTTRVRLAELVGRTPSGVTRALQPLEKLGYVTTVKDGRDARRSLAALTPAGSDLVADGRAVVHDVLDGFPTLGALTVERRDALLQTFQELRHG